MLNLKDSDLTPSSHSTKLSKLYYVVLSGDYEDLYLISGQRPLRTIAKKSISTFRIFKGQKVGAKVTLRNKIMWSFVKRFINVALLRERNFLGFNEKSITKNAFSCGFSDVTIFPEVDDARSSINETRGINITMVFRSDSRQSTISLLSEMGIPIRKI
ncbi:50S ribosomal protein L5 [Lyticum sinuosum]|uniref:50S ribosomal protein L5 n=1 Tax=Lyticum sinuosum TaxID=1332059 RepID=A0AAE5AHJ0_9RICK|nr:50S ribosomal protein L5 [Lyticum sinuosum]MDZ5761178.1 50S ribosomal protein L5 [Lyticum sinuosum]